MAASTRFHLLCLGFLASLSHGLELQAKSLQARQETELTKDVGHMFRHGVPGEDIHFLRFHVEDSEESDAAFREYEISLLETEEGSGSAAAPSADEFVDYRVPVSTISMLRRAPFPFDTSRTRLVGSERVTRLWRALIKKTVPGLSASFETVLGEFKKYCKTWVIGGTVRDLVQNKKSNDIDLCFHCDSGILKWVSEQNGWATPVVQPQYIMIGDDSAPDYLEGLSIDLAMQGPDFTVNSIFYQLETDFILDPTGFAIEDCLEEQVRIPNPDWDAWISGGMIGANKNFFRYLKLRTKGYKMSDALHGDCQRKFIMNTLVRDVPRANSNPPFPGISPGDVFSIFAFFGKVLHHKEGDARTQFITNLWNIIEEDFNVVASDRGECIHPQDNAARSYQDSQRWVTEAVCTKLPPGVPHEWTTNQLEFCTIARAKSLQLKPPQKTTYVRTRPSPDVAPSGILLPDGTFIRTISSTALRPGLVYVKRGQPTMGPPVRVERVFARHPVHRLVHTVPRPFRRESTEHSGVGVEGMGQPTEVGQIDEK